MEKSFALALDQSREMLKDLKWEDYEEILFISKSIGTAVAAAFGKEKGLKVRHVFFTPLKETFSF
ncbi:MAG: alpha/beta hydrolase, partial [Lachnospiraceae bacterium]|nr:alpha/beta hydrolase [Lachnospiraceae bacterium]